MRGMKAAALALLPSAVIVAVLLTFPPLGASSASVTLADITVTATETATVSETATETATTTATETATATATATTTATATLRTTATAVRTATKVAVRTTTRVIPGIVTVRTFTPPPGQGPPVLVTVTAPPQTLTSTPTPDPILASPAADTSAPTSSFGWAWFVVLAVVVLLVGAVAWGLTAAANRGGLGRHR